MLKFFLVFVSIFCVSVWAFSYPPSGALPSIGYMGLGFDALNGQPITNSFRYPVIDVTYVQNWTIPVSGIRYSFPDQVFVIPANGMDSVSHAQVFTSPYQLQQSLTSSLTQGYSVEFLQGMFGNSSQATYFSQQNKMSAYTAWTNQRVKSWKAGFSTKNSTSFFASAVAKLPTTYNNSTCHYFAEFIDNFGTHYLSQILFGGSISMNSSFSTAQYNKVGSAQVAIDLQTQLQLLQLGSSATSQQQQQLQQLNSIYHSQTQFEGGDVSLYSISQWSEWAASVPSRPTVVSMELVLLSEILPAAYANRKAALELAISSYLSKGWPSGWTAKAPMPTFRIQFALAAVEETIYAIAGNMNNNAGNTSPVEAFNTLTNSWTTKTPMPSHLYGVAGATVNGTVYVMGGSDVAETVYSTVQSYSPQTNSWTTRPSLPTARSSLSAAVVNGIIYAIGGYNKGYLKTVEAFNPQTQTWTTKSPMPTARSNMAVGVVDGTIYVMGGEYSHDHYLSTVEAYNTASNSWSTVAPLPVSLGYLAGASVDGTVYALGGRNSTQYDVTSTYAYSPHTNSWTLKDFMPTIETEPVATVVSGVIYAIAGNVQHQNANPNQAFVPFDVAAMNCPASNSLDIL